MILVNSVLKKDENYYLHVFQKECRYIEKENIIDDVEIFSEDSDQEKLSFNKRIKMFYKRK